MKRQSKIKNLCFLHVVLFIYSLISVAAKRASEETGINFIFGYCIVLFLLAIYAVLWQQVLKQQLLSVAFANKAVVIIWGIIWGFLLYKETISITKIVGAVIIMVGIIFVVCENGQ